MISISFSWPLSSLPVGCGRREGALVAAGYLVEHYSELVSAYRLPLAPPRGGRRPLRLPSHADGGNIALDYLHNIVHCKACGNAAARTVDVEVDVCVRIFTLEEEELGYDQVGDVVVDGVR